MKGRGRGEGGKEGGRKGGREGRRTELEGRIGMRGELLLFCGTIGFAGLCCSWMRQTPSLEKGVRYCICTCMCKYDISSSCA